MANILLKNINQGFHNRLAARAKIENKKLQELIMELLEEGMAEPVLEPEVGKMVEA